VDDERDFFISYTQADRAWAEWLAWELNAAGYTTLLQAWDMPPGTAFAHAMDQAVQTIRRTMLVLSPAYLRSEMAEAEWRPGFLGDPSGSQRRLLPVRVEDCKPMGLLADRVHIDLVGLDEATARATLLDGVARAIRGPGPPTTRPRFPQAPATAALDRPRFPTALPPVWNVPYRRNPDFTGRDGELAALAAALEQGETVAVTQVLQGGGGVGKTALAAEYAYRDRARFDTVWWVRGQEPTTLIGDYAGLAVTLGLVKVGEADQQLAALAVRHWLEAHDRWLLILDNAESPETSTGLEAPLDTVAALLPQVVHGQVLVTSRDARWEQHAALAELEVFTENEAVAFLLTRSGGSDEQAADAVAELLGWLPLALEQAGAYVCETRIALSAYLDRLRQFPALTLARGRPRDRDPADTVATTWQVSLAQVRPIPLAVALLEVCAFLGSEEIPRQLLAQQLDPAAEELATPANDPFALDEAVAAGRRFGLVKASEHTLVMHRLLQQVVRDGLDPGQQHSRAATALRLLRAALPADHTNPEAWPAYARLVPHVLAATGHAEALGVDPDATAWLLTEAGLYLRQRADLQQARVLHERALAMYEARLGPDDPNTAHSLNNLAGVLHAQGDLDTARTLYERALAICETCLGPHHPDTAEILANLAGIRYAQGDLQAARNLHERALEIRQVSYGDDHLHTASSLSNLAEVLQALSHLDQARQLCERALSIRETRLGPDHPHTAHSLRKLAGVLHHQGALDAARTRHERALRIFETHLGPDHPDTAHSRNDLAVVLRDQGDLDTARTLLEHVVRIREAHHGVDHPRTARSLHNLALVLRDQGDLDGARRLFERALSIREARLGTDHPDTAASLNDLARALQAQGDLDRARTLHQRALAIREKRLGPDHPDTATSRQDLARFMAALENRQ
jgi:tetratricopeptide (TPR) repeat protein